MVIRRLRAIDYLLLGVMIVYLIDIGNLKYAMAGLFVVFYLILGFANRRILTMEGMGQGFFTIFCGLCVLFLITFLLQIVNGFLSYALNEVIYFITPLFVVWAYISVTGKKTMGKMLDYGFLMLVCSYLIQVYPNLSFENLLRINFVESTSPFESGAGYLFLLYEWLYLCRGKKKKGFFSMVCCILCFRRFCMLTAIFLFIFAKPLSSPKPVKRGVFNVFFAAFVAIPAVTCLLMNDAFNEWFYQTFNISLHDFTLSRSGRIEMVVNSDEMKYGLGSTTVYITKVFQEVHQSEVEQWNLHNDIVRIYVECGLLGTIAFTYTFLKSAAFNGMAFTMMCYIFAECNVNHLLGAGTVFFWIIAYLMLAYFAENEPQSTSEPEEKPALILKWGRSM